MKHEMREYAERERQFIKIIQTSPELMRALDMEDSSMLEQRNKSLIKEKEVAIVSSKQIPINKLDLQKVADI